MKKLVIILIYCSIWFRSTLMLFDQIHLCYRCRSQWQQRHCVFTERWYCNLLQRLLTVSRITLICVQRDVSTCCLSNDVSQILHCAHMQSPQPLNTNPNSTPIRELWVVSLLTNTILLPSCHRSIRCFCLVMLSFLTTGLCAWPTVAASLSSVSF